MIGGLISVVVGSAVSAASRAISYRASDRAPRWRDLPVGHAFVVNITGAFVIGLCGGLATDNASLLGSPELWLLAVTGFCGGYTTVSSFALQTLTLARGGERGRAAAYVVLSVVLCLAAVAGGFAVVGALK